MLPRNLKQKANQALNKLSSRMMKLHVEMHQKATHVMRMKYLLIRVELLSV
jgi:prefoldin subunit 5